MRWLPLIALFSCGSVPILAQDKNPVPSAHDWIRQQAREAALALQFRGQTPEEARQWQNQFAVKLRSLLGPYAPPRKWQTILEKSTELADHRRDDLVLIAEGLPPLPICLLVPREKSSGRRPGILAIHGHGPRGHLAIADGQAGLHLVRQGYVVATPCLTPFGRRLDDPLAYGKQDPCGVTFIRMQLFGKVLIAENLRDCLWALEHLARQDNVDPDRLGCVGLSYGGRMTMLTTALEPRLKVAMISGALNVMQERVAGRYSCGAQIIPGLLQFGDVPEIGSLIAPRPCVWEMGLQDKLIDPTWADQAIARMKKIYQAYGKEDDLQIDRFDGGHTWSWRLADPLFAKVLGK